MIVWGKKERPYIELFFLKEYYMPNKIIQDRASGAIMGAFIGDALGANRRPRG